MTDMSLLAAMEEINRTPTMDQMWPMYEAIRNHSSSAGRDGQVLYLVTGGGALADFRALEECYAKDGDSGAYAFIELDQPQGQFDFHGEIRHVGSKVRDVLRAHFKFARHMRYAVVFDNSAREGKAEMGGLYFAANTKLGAHLNDLESATTRETAAMSSFTRYPVYAGENRGPRQFMLDHAPEASQMLGYKIERIGNESIYEGPLPDYEEDTTPGVIEGVAEDVVELAMAGKRAAATLLNGVLNPEDAATRWANEYQDVLRSERKRRRVG